MLAAYIELGLHLDGYGGSEHTSYRDYIRDDGGEIRQRLKLSTMPIGTTLRLVSTGRRTKIAPYIGAGIDAVFYWYEEEGDFIDFYDPTLPILPDRFSDDDVAFGLHAVGGVRFAINEDFGIVIEGRISGRRRTWVTTSPRTSRGS